VIYIYKSFTAHQIMIIQKILLLRLFFCFFLFHLIQQLDIFVLNIHKTTILYFLILYVCYFLFALLSLLINIAFFEIIFYFLSIQILHVWIMLCIWIKFSHITISFLLLLTAIQKLVNTTLWIPEILNRTRFISLIVFTSHFYFRTLYFLRFLVLQFMLFLFH